MSVTPAPQNNLLIEDLSNSEEEPAEGTLPGPDAPFLEDLLGSGTSSEGMLYAEVDFYPELGKDWGPLGTMTEEEYRGSVYDPEC